MNDIIKVLLKFYYPTVSKHLLKHKISEYSVIILKIFTRSLELGLFSPEKICDIFPLLNEVSIKLSKLESYFMDNLNDTGEDENQNNNEEKDTNNLNSPEKNDEKSFDKRTSKLPIIFIEARIEIAKILIQAHLLFADNCIVDWPLKHRKSLNKEVIDNDDKTSFSIPTNTS